MERVWKEAGMWCNWGIILEFAWRLRKTTKTSVRIAVSLFSNYISLLKGHHLLLTITHQSPQDFWISGLLKKGFSECNDYCILLYLYFYISGIIWIIINEMYLYFHINNLHKCTNCILCVMSDMTSIVSWFFLFLFCLCTLTYIYMHNSASFHCHMLLLVPVPGGSSSFHCYLLSASSSLKSYSKGLHIIFLSCTDTVFGILSSLIFYNCI